ncbi:MAG: helix-turn-helix domain-containing protein [Terriglobia bacterium]
MAKMTEKQIAKWEKTRNIGQEVLAKLLGVSVRTLQDWEQGRREPNAAAQTLIKVAEKHPKVLREFVA